MKAWVQEHGKRLLEQIEKRKTNPQPLLTFTGWESNVIRTSLETRQRA